MNSARPKFVFTDTPTVERKARVALIGPTGGGKTYTGLQVLAELINPGQMIAVIDTERESAYVYKDKLDVPFKWVNLTVHHPENYIAAIEDAEEAGIFGGLLIDSLSHAWTGKEGALELVDQVSARNRGQSNFFSWREVTPFHNALVNKLIACNLHLVVTMRSKMDYVVEEYQDNNGKKKTSVRKIGLQPIQRDGLEYEFDVVGDLDPENNRLVISKTRCSDLARKYFVRDGYTPGKVLRDWLRRLAETSPASVKPPVQSPSNPANAELCDAFIARIREATPDNILIIKDEAKAALEHDKRLLAQFHAAYIARYTTIVSPQSADVS